MALTDPRLPGWLLDSAQQEADRRGVSLELVLVELRATVGRSLYARAMPDAGVDVEAGLSRHMNEYMLARPPDPEFAARLERSIERNRELLDLLAET